MIIEVRIIVRYGSYNVMKVLPCLNTVYNELHITITITVHEVYWLSSQKLMFDNC